MARWRQPCANAIAETTPLFRPNGAQVCRAGCRQDLSENNISDAAINPEPTRNVGLMAKCSSAIHRDRMSDTKAVSAGTKFQNMVTKPLSPPVTVSEI
jgi:hypothetical protein